jgi:hypothetical protein
MSERTTRSGKVYSSSRKRGLEETEPTFVIEPPRRTITEEMTTTQPVVEETRRPVKVVAVPEGIDWPTQNMSFYRSSGGGNPRFNNLFSGTWVPFYGTKEDGTIVKHSTLVQDYFTQFGIRDGNLPWHIKLCQLLVHRDGRITNKDGGLFDVKKNVTNAESTEGNFIYNSDLLPRDYDITLNENLYTFVTSYFSTWWQLQVSASFGGGFWDNVQLSSLREFILNHRVVRSDENIRQLKDPMLPKKTVEEKNRILVDELHFVEEIFNQDLILINEFQPNEIWIQDTNDILIENDSLIYERSGYFEYIPDANYVNLNKLLPTAWQRFSLRVNTIFTIRRTTGLGKTKRRQRHKSKTFSLKKSTKPSKGKSIKRKRRTRTVGHFKI